MATVVTAPDGTRWRVARRWLPWTLRRRKLDLEDLAFVPEPPALLGAVDDVLGAVVGIVVAIIGFVLLVVFVVPALLVIFEAALLVVLAVLGVFARVLFRRPWIVEVSRVGHPGRVAWKVKGWRRTDEVIAEIARRLQAGENDLELRLPGVSRA